MDKHFDFSQSHKCLQFFLFFYISHCNQRVEMNIVFNFWQLVLPSNEVNEGTNGNQAQATPNETGCAGDEKIEAKKVHIILFYFKEKTNK